MEQSFSFKSKFTPIDLILEVLGLTVLIFILVLTIYFYPRLPDIIPTHINYIGLADEFGKKSNFFLLPILSIVIYSLFTILNRESILLRNVDNIFGNKPEQTYKLTRRFIRFLKLSVLLLFISSILYDISLMKIIKIKIPAYCLWLEVLILLLIPMAIFFFLIFTQKKPEIKTDTQTE
jgi:uncharacterized membrane protein